MRAVSSRARKRTHKSRQPAPKPGLLASTGRETLVLGLLIAVATVAVYLPVRHHPFINFDDPAYVVNNPHIKSGLDGETISWAFTTFYQFNWHPLTWLSHALDVQMFQLDPGGHHDTNLLLHVVNVLLLFWVLRRATGDVGPSAIVAALFALHPINVESVAWVAERKDVLSTTFGLIALSFWLNYVAHPSLGRYLAVMLWFAASLMSKPMLVTLPFLLLLLDYWPLGRWQGGGGAPGVPACGSGVGEPGAGGGEEGQSSRRAPRAVGPAVPAARFFSEAGGFWRTAKGLCLLPCVVEKVPLVLMSAASCFVTVIAQSRGYAVVPLARHSLAARLATVVQAYCGYLWKMAVPVNLAPIYPLPKSVNYATAIACGIALVVLTILLIWTGRARRHLTVGWFWYLGMLVPVIGIVHVGMQSMADRYSYLPLVGIFILVAWSAAEAVAHRPCLAGPLAGLTSAALVACCLLTSAQVRRWASAETLFTHTAAVTEDNSAALTNLGLVAIHKEDYVEAERRLREALRLDPTYIDALGNLGSMYIKQKNFDAAIQQYARILTFCPKSRKAFSEMARAFTEQGNHPQAEVWLRGAVELEPASVELHFRLAEIQQRLGKTEEALENYSMVLRLRPNERGALNNIAWIRATHPDARFRDGTKAVELLRPLVRSPDCDANVLDTVAAAYAEAGRFDDALQTAQIAIEKARSQKATPESMADMHERAALYKKHQAYRDQQLLGRAK